jgi:hypothetical protein
MDGIRGVPLRRSPGTGLLAADLTGFFRALRDAAHRAVQEPERLTSNTYCI